MARTWLVPFLLSVVLTLAPATADAGRRATVRKLRTATAHVQDKRYSEAQAILDAIEAETTDLDRRRYRAELRRFTTLRGIVRLNLGASAAAVRDLDRSVALHRQHEVPLDEIVLVYQGIARVDTGDPASGLRSLDAAGQRGADLGAWWEMRAEARRALGQLDLARGILVKGLERHPEHLELYRRLALVELQADHVDEATTAAARWLGRDAATVDDYRRIAHAAREHGHSDTAAALLKEGLERFGETPALERPSGRRLAFDLADRCRAGCTPDPEDECGEWESCSREAPRRRPMR